MVQFTITKVTDCVGGGYPGEPPPVGTKRKLVWLEVQTGPNFDSTLIHSGDITRFAAIDAAGVTSGEINPSTFWACAPIGKVMGHGDEAWLPGKKYAGAIEVYLPDDAVVITNGRGSWEWTIR
ncbi:MAG TPA: hypothetical protein VM677_10820 [Actinokineospora sp.]|jgi:hypothetical protein|nr:hypothetical protein [Actinokineospora sp.]